MSNTAKIDFKAKLNSICKRVWEGTKNISLKVWAFTKRLASDIWSFTKRTSKKAFNGFMNAKAFWSAFAILVILFIISIVVLSIRLHDYSKIDDRSVSLRSSMDETLDVFAIEYQNETGDVTIKSSDESSVLAPGSKVEYTLRLRNTDNVALDYAFTPTLEYTSKYELPIMIRLLDPNDEYVIGSATEWVMLDDIDDVEYECTGVLTKNETAEYVFQWQWPYEWGEDEYDTYLASLKYEDYPGVSLSFEIHAEANTELKSNGGFFASHPGKITVILIIAILLAIAIALLLIYIMRRMRESAVPVLVEAPDVPIVEAPATADIPVVEMPAAEPLTTTEEAPLPVFTQPWTPAPAFYGKMATVNIDTFEPLFNSGDTITISALKDKGLIPKSAKQMKILARSTLALTKAFVIETQGISKNAEAAICRAGGRVIITAPDKGDIEI